MIGAKTNKAPSRYSRTTARRAANNSKTPVHNEWRQKINMTIGGVNLSGYEPWQWVENGKWTASILDWFVISGSLVRHACFLYSKRVGPPRPVLVHRVPSFHVDSSSARPSIRDHSSVWRVPTPRRTIIVFFSVLSPANLRRINKASFSPFDFDFCCSWVSFSRFEHVSQW